MRRRDIRILAIVVALSAAAPTPDTPNRPVALLIDADSKATLANVTVTLGGERENKVHAAKGDLIYAGARLITGGARIRFLFFPDGYIYEFTPNVPASYPAPSYQAVDKTNTEFELLFTATKFTVKRGARKPVAAQKPVVRLAGIDPTSVEPAGGPDDVAALKRLDAALSQPENRQDPVLQLEKAVTLERTNQLKGAVSEYTALAGQWTEAAWLKRKIPELSAVSDALVAREAIRSRPPRTYAVIIGISKYQRLPQIDYADNDAALFKAHLKSPRGGAVPDGQIFTLTNEQATKAKVSKLLDQVFTKLAGPRDTVYIFFSGHGMSETAEKVERGFLLESDSDPQEKNSSAISLERLRDLMRAGSKSRLVVFADVCRIGSFQSGPNRINSVATEQLSLSHLNSEVAGILASRSEQTSQVAKDPQGGHGIFAFYLVKGLQGDADQNHDGEVTFNELFSYVEEQVSRATAARQKPGQIGKLAAEFSLSKPNLPGIQSLSPFRRSLTQWAALNPRPGMLRFRVEPDDPGPPPDAPGDSSVILENQGQQIILKYLRGDETPPKREEFERGRDLFAEANRLAPAASLEAKQLFFKGRALIFDTKIGPAIPPLELAVRLDPLAAYAYNGLGIAYLKQGLYPQAAWSLRDAIRLAPHWIYPRHNLALVYIEAGAYSPAEKEYREAIRLDPEAATLHYGLGLLLQRTNRNPDAGREYHEALRLNPNFAEAHTGLGAVLSAGGRKDQAQAVDEYQQALELKPDLTAARHDLALLYVKLKNDPGAIELWLENIRQSPEFLESRLSLADTYTRTGKFDEAIEQYKAVLMDHPDYAAASRALYEAQGDQTAAKGTKQAAADLYQKALRLAIDEEDRSRLKKKLRRTQK